MIRAQRATQRLSDMAAYSVTRAKDPQSVIRDAEREAIG